MVEAVVLLWVSWMNGLSMMGEFVGGGPKMPEDWFSEVVGEKSMGRWILQI